MTKYDDTNHTGMLDRIQMTAFAEPVNPTHLRKAIIKYSIQACIQFLNPGYGSWSPAKAIARILSSIPA